MAYKVLHVFSGYGGGISSVIWNLIKYVDDNTINQSIMCFSMEGGSAMVEDVEKHGGQIYIMPRKHIDGFFAFIKYLNKAFKPGMFDIIHCHIDGAMAIAFRLFATKAGVKHFIVHAHQSADKYGSQDQKKLKVIIRQILTNIAANERFSCGNQASRYVFGKKAYKKAFILNNCIDSTKYKDVFNEHMNFRAMLCDELTLNTSALIIGHVGRFDYPKNHRFLVDIAEALKEKGVDFVMVLVGDGALFESISELVRVKGLGKHIYFIGRRYDVPQLMRSFDLVLLPSLSEGFPTVAIEAQACGTPILVSEKVTHDADIGLGIVDYLPIDNAVMWADKIVRGLPYKKAEAEKVKTVLDKKRYWSNLVGQDYRDKILKIMEAKG